MESAPAKRPSRSARLAPPADVAFAICLVEVEGGGRQCYPILDIGVRGLRVESSAPLALGTVLGISSFSTGARSFAAARGGHQLFPGAYPDGRLVYECGVRYRTPVRVGSKRRPATASRSTTLARARHSLGALRPRVRGDGLGADRRGQGENVAATGDRMPPGPELRCRVSDADRLPIRSGAVTVECSLFGSGYRFYARITGRNEAVLTLSPSPKLREWHRRNEERTPLGPRSGAIVSYRHSLTGARRVHPLIDLSSRGSLFSPGAADEELWAGLPLKEVRIQLGELSFKPPAVAIRSVSPTRVGAEMRDLPNREADLLREKLIEHGPEPIQFHDGSGFDDLVAFHRSKRLLTPEMESSMTSAFDESRRTWRAAHARAAGLMRTAIVPWRGGSARR